MTEDATEKADSGLPVRRLVDLLQRLSEMGVNQSQVAQRARVQRQYLNDVVNRRRPLTKLFSQRLAEEFDFDPQWLMGTEDSPTRIVSPAQAISAASVWVPQIDEAFAGDPREYPRWRATYTQVSGVAAAKAARAALPYVLELGHGDWEGRLNSGDLVLISQSAAENPKLCVVCCGKKVLLARKKGAKWLRAETGAPLRGKCEVTGHCVGVIWSALI